MDPDPGRLSPVLEVNIPAVINSFDPRLCFPRQQGRAVAHPCTTDPFPRPFQAGWLVRRGCGFSTHPLTCRCRTGVSGVGSCSVFGPSAPAVAEIVSPRPPSGAWLWRSGRCWPRLRASRERQLNPWPPRLQEAKAPGNRDSGPQLRCGNAHRPDGAAAAASAVHLSMHRIASRSAAGVALALDGSRHRGSPRCSPQTATAPAAKQASRHLPRCRRW